MFIKKYINNSWGISCFPLFLFLFGLRFIQDSWCTYLCTVFKRIFHYFIWSSPKPLGKARRLLLSPFTSKEMGLEKTINLVIFTLAGKEPSCVLWFSSCVLSSMQCSNYIRNISKLAGSPLHVNYLAVG